MSTLTLKQVQKRFGATTVLPGVDLAIEEGEFVVFVGPSGCGKSTLLRIIAGLEESSGGEIRIGARDVTRVPPAQRGLAMVFQSYALYPHMNVFDNMAFGLRAAGLPPAVIDTRVAEAARVLQLDQLLQRKPKELSGGQRQRVAIGRAIVKRPAIFLFDEPLSNLDAALRVQMRIEIARLHRVMGATMIYVTHDQVEAMTLADRIVVFNRGAIEQVGTPRELYERPRNVFVAGFIGSPRMNLLPPLPCLGLDAGRVTQVGIRPEHVRLVDAGTAPLSGQVLTAEYLGNEVYAYVTLDGVSGEPIVVRLDGHAHLAPGQRVGVAFPLDHVHPFDAAGKVVRC